MELAREEPIPVERLRVERMQAWGSGLILMVPWEVEARIGRDPRSGGR